MNKHLQNILNFFQQDKPISEEEKTVILKSLKDADKEFEITSFKLDRTEKVKKTTAILLEETIEELEQKRKAVEAQNKELEIEASLERIRTVAMSMNKAAEILNICKTQFIELKQLGFTEIRNALISIFHDDENYFTDYDYSDFSAGSITNIPYHKNAIIDTSLQQMKSATDGFTEFIVEGKALEEWKAFRKQNGEYDDTRLDGVDALYYYFYSIEEGSVGISTFKKISETQLDILKRFRNVFDLAYKRYVDISNAAAQAREAQIETGLERVRSRSLAMHNTSELQEVIHAVHKELLHLNIAINGGSFIAINSDIQTQLRCWGSGGTADTSEEVLLPLYEKPFCSNLINGIKKGPGFFTEEFTQAEKKDFFRFLFQHEPWSKLDATQKEEILSSPGGYTRSCCVSPHSSIFIINHFGEKFSAADNDILKRFGKVFEQTYTRFLDLQKAEGQTREAQIQLALERVRARTMAMQLSDELPDAANILFQQIQTLGMPAWSAGYCIWDDDHQAFTGWMSSAGIIQQPFRAPVTDDPSFIHFYDAWKRGETFYVEEIGGNEIVSHYKYMCRLPVVGEMLNKFIADGGTLPAFQIFHLAFFSQGFLLFITYEPVPESHDIFKRFGNVFDQTYTRFLDLQKAEAQAKEAQIETALERVRARTMGMQKSEELKEVIRIVYDQLVHLNVNTEHAGFVIDYKLRDDRLIWVASKHGVPSQLTIPYFDCEYYNSFNEAKEKGSDFFATNLNFDNKNSFYRELFKYIPELPEDAREFYFSCAGLAISTVLLENVGLYIENFLGIPFTEEENAILMRFGKVFQQTYTRFIDLQKAEEQTRAAQIELAVERVRAKALAMHNSTQILEVVATLRNEMLGLEIPGVVAATIYLQQDEEGYIRMWDLSSVMEMEDGFHVALDVKFKLDETDPSFYVRRVWNNHDNYFVEKQDANDMTITIAWLRQYYPEQAAEVQQFIDSTPWQFLLHPTIQLTHGKMSVDIMDTQPPAAMESIMQKMGAAFDLAYKRFLDLQKSERQIREGQIELALERVRARTMAMQHSDELAEASLLLDSQVRALGIPTRGCGFNIYGDQESTEWFSSELGTMPTYKTPREDVFLRLYEQGKSGATIYIEEFNAERCAAHYQYLLTIPGIGDGLKKMVEAGGFFPVQQVDHAVYFKYGYLLFITLEPAPEAHDIFMRFAKVFEQTYTRFLDLQKAEAQTKEFQIENALERVRSRTLAMQKSDELADTSAVLFQQLIGLGIAPHRLYISIIKDTIGNSEFWITDEDGTKVSTAFKTNLNDNPSFFKMLQGWKDNKKSITIDMQGEELDTYFEHLTSLGVPFQGGLEQKRRIQTFAYFSQGFIGMASPDEQPEETTLLLERFAAVFNLTYTRFNDLKVAEAHAVQAEEDLIKLQTEKKRAEDALSELRATQTQLIQSEKMASLGELTAGIAHEIQNPLNFVNNFSEVSNELIDEMYDEIEKGDMEEAKAIANDIKQNLEKINHHGKRADAIVKGMLQHSRSSSATKEPTDINKLADEYLRLAYHGLRAKDKSFNAILNTDYDDTLEKVNVIPQDIGRVILNLITNAFYAAPLPPQGGFSDPGYIHKPTVWVSTKKEGNKVLISVRDNGPGIPQNIIDKIFQPFFTTKPTGQGTGLGLSLAYDIVKAHGGELKVETKENEGLPCGESGTTFIIQLPV